VTPLETLVAARRTGVRISVDAASHKLVVEADEAAPPADVIAAIKEHRDRLVEMLTLTSAREPFPGEWQDLAQRADDLPADQSTQPVVVRLSWQASDHTCSTACVRQHLVCNACAQPLQPQWRHWPWLHGNCRLEQVDQ
jgi:hypothetical protein